MKEKENNIFLKETARDTIALGGIAFYILIIARASIAPYLDFVYQLLLAIIVLILLNLIIKNSENRIARVLIAAFFTILFYNMFNFTIFAIIILMLVFVSAFYLKIEKIKIIKGIILAIISIITSYYLTPILIKLLNLPITF